MLHLISETMKTLMKLVLLMAPVSIWAQNAISPFTQENNALESPARIGLNGAFAVHHRTTSYNYVLSPTLANLGGVEYYNEDWQLGMAAGYSSLRLYSEMQISRFISIARRQTFGAFDAGIALSYSRGHVLASELSKATYNKNQLVGSVNLVYKGFALDVTNDIIGNSTYELANEPFQSSVRLAYHKDWGESSIEPAIGYYQHYNFKRLQAQLASTYKNRLIWGVGFTYNQPFSNQALLILGYRGQMGEIKLGTSATVSRFRTTATMISHDLTICFYPFKRDTEKTWWLW